MRYGFDFPWDQVGLDDTCPALDPQIYPADLAELVQDWDWGLAVLPLDPDLLPELEASVVENEGQAEWDAYWVDAVVGGGAHFSSLDEVWLDGWALGFDVDEDMRLLNRDTPGRPPHDPSTLLPLSREAIHAAAVLPRGVYLVDSFIEFDAQELLQ